MVPEDSARRLAAVQDGDHLFALREGGHDGGTQDVSGKEDDGLLVLVASSEGVRRRLEASSSTRGFLSQGKREREREAVARTVGQDT